MNTPVYDFVRGYASEGVSRLHMPGHKGKPFLGCEPFDITEVKGADALYEADGIIAQSEQNATALFGTQRTFYSTEGSSQCIRAMVYLAVTCRGQGRSNTILAGRNAHKAFLYAAALVDCDITWLWPKELGSLCASPITPTDVEEALSQLKTPPAAVYVTSPDYLGNLLDIEGIANVCHRYGTLLLVDNAHGAYLKFLCPSRHPMDLGADLCCDSAHKTLPVLTGGAYLHVGKTADPALARRGKAALGLFGSTSPSYLTLASLDLCNRYLADGYEKLLGKTVEGMNRLKAALREKGWRIGTGEPLKLTVECGGGGDALAERLRRAGIECEFASPDHLVLMFTPENDEADYRNVETAMGSGPRHSDHPLPPVVPRCEQVLPVRQAMFAPQRPLGVDDAVGRVCGTPTVSCPPAIAVVVSGERISREAAQVLKYYGTHVVDVVET